MLLRKANMAGEQRSQVRALMADGRLRTASEVGERLGMGPKMARDRLNEIGCGKEQPHERMTFWFLERETQDEEDARDSMAQERLFSGGGL